MTNYEPEFENEQKPSTCFSVQLHLTPMGYEMARARVLRARIAASSADRHIPTLFLTMMGRGVRESTLVTLSTKLLLS